MQRLPKLLIFVLALSLSGGGAACLSSDKPAPQPDAAQPSPTDTTAAAKPAESLPDAAELLAAHVQAAGGADKIATFETIHAVGKIDAGQQKLVGTSELWWQKGGKFYLEQDVEGVGKSRAGYDGTTIWLDDPISGLRILEGDEAQSYIHSSIMFPGHEWREHFSEAKTIGKQTLADGSEAWEVELVAKTGPNLVLGLDASTKLIRYTKTNQVTPMGQLPIQSEAQDYRDVQGYKFAMRKHSSVKALIELDEEITAFEVNVPIDASKFAYPTKLEQVPADPSQQPPVEPPAPAPAQPG
jgi:hypothetical protein